MTDNSTSALWTPARKAALAGLIAAQFAIAYVVGTQGWLANDGQALFPPIAVTAVVPVALFLTAYAASGRFRSFVLAQDMAVLTRLQLWRVVGFTFLALYAYNVLPGLFALPAGVGDVAVGITAAFAASRLDADASFATSRRMLAFHIMGLTDFAVAIGTAALAGGALPALVPEGVTSAPMDVWPLNLFPSFIVPAFIILQAAALLKWRHLRRGLAARPVAVAQAA